MVRIIKLSMVVLMTIGGTGLASSETAKQQDRPQGPGRTIAVEKSGVIYENSPQELYYRSVRLVGR